MAETGGEQTGGVETGEAGADLTRLDQQQGCGGRHFPREGADDADAVIAVRQ